MRPILRPQASKTLFFRHFGASKAVLTKARLLKHDFPVHGCFCNFYGETLFCVLLRSFADSRLRSFCALLRAFAWFYVRLRLGTTTFGNFRISLVWFSWISRDMPILSAPIPSRRGPPPDWEISGLRSLGLCYLFLPA